jgi:hypothetical protein
MSAMGKRGVGVFYRELTSLMPLKIRHKNKAAIFGNVLPIFWEKWIFYLLRFPWKTGNLKEGINNFIVTYGF